MPDDIPWRRPLKVEDVGTRVRMYSFLPGVRDLIGEGEVIAYSGAPQVLIRREDGTQFWWRADAPHKFLMPGDGDQPKPLDDEPRPDVPSKPIPKPPPKPK